MDTPVPIVSLCGPLADPSPLHSDQIRELLTLADDVGPADRDIWFILLEENDLFLPQSLRLTIHFDPEHRSPRLVRGDCIRWGARLDPVRSRYVHVSRPPHSFAEQLPVPDGVDVPFTAEPDIGDDELVQSVDLARRAMLARYDRQEAPLLSVHQLKGQIQVDFGHVHWPRFATGTTVALQRGERGLEVVSVSQWMS